MSVLASLRDRLKARPDSEHEQAMLRIVLVGLITTYMWGRANATTGPMAEHDRILLTGLVVFFLLAIAIFVAICIRPEVNVPRRILGMLSDAGGNTFALFLTEESGVGLIGVFLFITFGNGFRYGRKYLFLCQALCLTGFVPVVLFAPWWQTQPYIGWGLVISLIVLPLYVSTLLKRIEEARSKAEEASRAKTAFLANMSHEMRTPLNGIVGVTDLLQTTALSPEQSELVRLQRHSVALLRSLVDDVLDISKIESGRVNIEVIDFDLYAIVNNVAKMMRPHAAAKGLAFRARVDPSIDSHVRGDTHHLRQVLVNLVSNAIKFTEQGSIEITVTLAGETAEGYHVRFEVADTGIGIAPEHQRKIFEQFVQADDSITRRYGGTGLGTTIAKQLVELMGGSIGLDSRLAAGSTFWFELPLLRSERSREAVVVKPRVLLVAEPSAEAQVLSFVRTACGDVEALPTESAVVARLDAIRKEDAALPPVLVSGSIESAVAIFERVTKTFGESCPALIFVATAAHSEAERGRLRRIDKTTYVGLDTSPRILSNALHAASPATAAESAEIIDLGLIIKQQRQQLRVLVAEDNGTNRAIAKQLLESAGHTVFLAGDGEEALDVYEQESPDLAILDFNMPERSGIEVATAIRTMEPTGTRLPIIILSASVTPDTQERARRAGADEFVGKPFDAVSLLESVDRLARRAPRRDGAPSRPPATVSLGGIPLIDNNRVREVMSIATDSAFLGKLVEGFCADMEGLLGRLEASAGRGQFADLADITHAMRGASVGIGAQQLAARCQGLEDAARKADAGRVRIGVREVQRCFVATAAQLRGYVPGPQRARTR